MVDGVVCKYTLQERLFVVVATLQWRPAPWPALVDGLGGPRGGHRFQFEWHGLTPAAGMEDRVVHTGGPD